MKKQTKYDRERGGRLPIATETTPAELEGYMEMGMQHEALRLARDYLRADRVGFEKFWASLDAILILEDHPVKWRQDVEKAFDGLSKKDRRKARSQMLSFYYTLKEYSSAERFMPRRFTGPTWFTDLAFGLHTKMALGKREEATRIALNAARALEGLDEDHYGLNVVKEAFAHFFLSYDEWDAAIELFEQLQEDEMVAESAMLGLIEAHVRRTLAAIRTAHEALERLGERVHPALEVTLPGNDAKRWADMGAKLARIERLMQCALKACGGINSSSAQTTPAV